LTGRFGSCHNPRIQVESNRGTRDSSEVSVSDRLDTWKEVASHLRRSVRTVQRWERDEGLPVHRHHHDKQGSIYAFKPELDEWWTARGAALDHAADSLGPETPEIAATDRAGPRAGVLPFRIRRAVVGLTLAAVSIAAVVFVAARSGSEPTVAAHGEPHRILIASFENHTTEGELDARLHDTLQDELGAHRLANVVPADQTASFLRLMRKPANTMIDGTIAREISLRDGGIDAYVVGAVDRLGSQYVATIRFSTPAEAVVVTSFSARAETAGQLLEDVRRQLRSRRREIDTALPHDSRSAALPRVTTSSFRALELYSEAVTLMDHVPIKTDPAFELLMEAVRLDPEFASAHILAAWSMYNAKRPQSMQMPHAERAYNLADTTSDAERYFILGSYYQLTMEVEKAIASYEALLRLDATHYWALGNLGRLYRAVERHDDASELHARRVVIRPKQFWGNFRLAEAMVLRGDLEGSEEYAVRAAAQISETDPQDMQSRRSWLAILPACKAWLRDDIRGALRAVEELELTLPSRQGADRQAMLTSIAYMYLALGRRAAAEHMLRELAHAGDRLYHLAMVGAHFGDQRSIREYFESNPEPTSPWAAFHGLPAIDRRWFSQADAVMRQWTTNLEAADQVLVRGQLALMRGATSEAIKLLNESIAMREDRSGAPALSAKFGVARAFSLRDDSRQAIRLLEEASRNRFSGCLWPTASAHLWIQFRAELADIYRSVGRDAAAVEIESHLRALLAFADEHHPVFRRLKHRLPRGAVDARN
jgi:tetratricopeptide (TPR) repeat protein